MHLSTLSEWLSWIGSVHSTEIDLGLDRVKAVAERLNLFPFTSTMVSIAGTNGKGSTVAGLSAIYRKAGYRVGEFTSPVLLKHNEQVAINGEHPSDEAFCQAFAAIENVRGTTSLTPFEFHTLAALWLFKQQPLDVLLLEVGLGGRLDAVNIVDADVAVVTSIDMDHCDWLGDTRESIGYEKAGIFRRERPAVYGDTDPPQSLLTHAKQLNTPLYCQGKAFQFHEHPHDWSWSYQDKHYEQLPLGQLAPQNLANVLMVTTLLQDRLPVSPEALYAALANLGLPGRLQVVEGPVTEIYDVSHNPAAVAWLVKRLKAMPCTGKTYAVFSMLVDKDMTGSIQCINDHIDAWHVAPLTVPRAATHEHLQTAFAQAGTRSPVTWLPDIKAAYQTAKQQAQPGDKIVVFGSFHTIAAVMLTKQPLL